MPMFVRQVTSLRDSKLKVRVGTAAVAAFAMKVQTFDDTLLPFIADPDDHAETPDVAYRDVSLFLSAIAKYTQTTDAEVLVWDPYYCQARQYRSVP